MPMTYRIDSRRRLVLTHATGVLTDDDVIAHKERLLRDPEFRSDMAELSDVRAIERLAVTATGVAAMVAHDTNHAGAWRGHRLALVVTSDVAFGMARMYQSLGDDGQGSVGVFRTMEEAEAWLGGA